MGVQIYLLDHRRVTLLVDGRPVKIGTLRRSWKITEMEGRRESEIEAANLNLAKLGAPPAVMLAEVTKIPLASEANNLVSAHQVIGWDADRSSVTDLHWDYLPILGYAVTTGTAKYALHDDRGGLLYPMDTARAIELRIMDNSGDFRRWGQPLITNCRAVRPFISTYAQADCTLSNGQSAEILTSIESGLLPDSTWYIGKRPADVAHFLSR